MALTVQKTILKRVYRITIIICIPVILLLSTQVNAVPPQISSTLKTKDETHPISMLINDNAMPPRQVLIHTNNKMHMLTNPFIEWQTHFGGQFDDEGEVVQETIDGGYIILSNFYAGDPSIVGAHLIKTDAQGNQQWDKVYTLYNQTHPYGYCLQQTTDGGYIIAGDAGDVWLLKTNTAGTVEWNKTYTHTDIEGYNSSFGWSVQQTTDDGYIIVSTLIINSSAKTGIIKTDSFGQMEWNKTYEDCIVYSRIIQTTDHGYAIIGTLGDNSGIDMILLKIDPHGNELWRHIYGKGHEYGFDGQQTADGGYIMTGYTTTYAKVEGDVWLVKTDSNGREEWNRSFDPIPLPYPYGQDDYGRSVQQTVDGGYIIGGHTWDYPYGTNVYAIKTDVLGKKQWDFLSDEQQCSDLCLCIRQTSDGGYILTGSSTLNSYGGFDVLLMKLKNVTLPSFEITNVTGGLTLKYTIRNNGDAPALAARCKLNFSAKTFLCPWLGSLTQFVDNFTGHSEVTITQPVIGFIGLIKPGTVTITITADNAPTETMTRPVKVFLFKVTIQH